MVNYPLVAVIVPVHNNKEDTREFLESLNGVGYPNYEIIIIDDGSTDGTEEMIRQGYPEIKLIKGDGNLWWSRATNRGIEKALEMGAKYVLLAENDHRANGDFLSALVDTAEKNPRSIVFSKVCSYDDSARIYNVGWEVNWLRGGLCRVGVNELDEGQYEVQRNSKAANVNMLINTAFFKDLGMFDHKNLPQYWADIDFTYRAYKNGYCIIYEPKSVIWNKGQSTTKPMMPQTASLLTTFKYFATDKRSPRNFRDSTLFYWKHCPKALLPYLLAQNAFWVFVGSLLLCVRHIMRQLRRKARGVGD